MNDFDDLADLFGPLRSAATDAELAGETSNVDAMARHHRRQKGHDMFTSRRARVATFVAAGIIGFGGIAAASPGGPLALTDSDVPTTGEAPPTTGEAPPTTGEAPPTTGEAPPTTGEAPPTSSEVVEDDASITRSVIEETTETDDDMEKCLGKNPADFDNHGEFVRAVARNEDGFEGIEQRDAAQSSCGKDDDVEAVDEDDEIEDVEDVEVKDDDGDAGDDGDSDDSDDGDRSEKSGKPDKSGKSDKPGKPGKPESAGKQGNGSKKNSGD